MNQDRATRQYIHLPVTISPASGTIEVSFDRTTWYPTTAESGGVYFLVAGPDASQTGAIPLALGSNYGYLRVTDNPEVILTDPPFLITVQ